MVTKEEFEVIYRMGRTAGKLADDNCIDDDYQMYLRSSKTASPKLITNRYRFSDIPNELQCRMSLIVNSYEKIAFGYQRLHWCDYLAEIADNSQEIRIIYHTRYTQDDYIDVHKKLFDIPEHDVPDYIRNVQLNLEVS